MIATPSIFAVTVNWNLAPDTIHCVRSFVAACLALSQLIVVDNASTDGSVAAVHTALGSGVDVLTCAANRGYAAGVNLGVRQALARDAGWILVLNNDTEVAA